MNYNIYYKPSESESDIYIDSYNLNYKINLGDKLKLKYFYSEVLVVVYDIYVDLIKGEVFVYTKPVPNK